MANSWNIFIQRKTSPDSTELRKILDSKAIKIWKSFEWGSGVAGGPARGTLWLFYDDTVAIVDESKGGIFSGVIYYYSEGKDNINWCHEVAQRLNGNIPPDIINNINKKSIVPINNDGRATCYACGAITKKVQGFSSNYDICTKCGK